MATSHSSRIYGSHIGLTGLYIHIAVVVNIKQTGAHILTLQVNDFGILGHQHIATGQDLAVFFQNNAFPDFVREN